MRVVSDLLSALAVIVMRSAEKHALKKGSVG